MTITQLRQALTANGWRVCAINTHSSGRIYWAEDRTGNHRPGIIMASREEFRQWASQQYLPIS
jgi:hypothetical protein